MRYAITDREEYLDSNPTSPQTTAMTSPSSYTFSGLNNQELPAHYGKTDVH